MIEIAFILSPVSVTGDGARSGGAVNACASLSVTDRYPPFSRRDRA